MKRSVQIPDGAAVEEPFLEKSLTPGATAVKEQDAARPTADEAMKDVTDGGEENPAQFAI